MSKIGDRRGIKLKRAVLRVGDGRGFVVSSRNSIGGHERIVITAAHCLPLAVLQPVLLVACQRGWRAFMNVKIGSGGG
jgi:hypothetical protein